MSPEDERNCNDTQDCWICEQEITENKVRYHCHITGKFRDAERKKCNSKLKIPKKLPRWSLCF